MCPPMGRELEEEKGSMFVQGGGGGEAHLALTGGRQGKMVRAFLLCTVLATVHPCICFHPASWPVRQGMVKPRQKGRPMVFDCLICILQALICPFSAAACKEHLDDSPSKSCSGGASLLQLF